MTNHNNQKFRSILPKILMKNNYFLLLELNEVKQWEAIIHFRMNWPKFLKKSMKKVIKRKKKKISKKKISKKIKKNVLLIYHFFK